MYAGIISRLFDNLDVWSSNYWYLGVIFGLAYLDSVLPIVPSELCVIIGGVAVSTGGANYSLWLVIACGAAGAFLGDNSAYGLGRLFADRFERRAVRKPRFRKRLQWADDQLESRGGPLLITARFIPGGRTVLTLASGITRQPHRWFAGWTAIAAVIWAGYAAGLAYVIGKPFADNHTAALLVAFGAALVVNVAIEVVRKVRGHAKPAAAPADEVTEAAITDPQT
ncbi:MAG: DedA family protein [Actinomycetota bacterium]